MQVQGQHPHQWAPFQIAGLLHAWQISHQISRYIYHEGDSRELPLCNPSLSAASMSFWASQAHAFQQPICQRLSWLHHWRVPHVHTIGVFSPSEWGPDPQCQATQVTHWTWWWQCLAAWHCISVWSLPCHFVADAGSLALSMAKSRWHGALHSTHKSCTHGHVFWNRGGMKRGLVADPWTSSRQFSNVLWLKVHSHLLLRACLLSSKRKLPPQACQVRPGLPTQTSNPTRWLCAFEECLYWGRKELLSGFSPKRSNICRLSLPNYVNCCKHLSQENDFHPEWDNLCCWRLLDRANRFIQVLLEYGSRLWWIIICSLRQLGD